jgi:hypothetical protein
MDRNVRIWIERDASCMHDGETIRCNDAAMVELRPDGSGIVTAVIPCMFHGSMYLWLSRGQLLDADTIARHRV